MINEVLVRCKESLLPLLYILFSKIIDTGLYPETWSRSCIVPLFKKVMSMLQTTTEVFSCKSCVGKLFTSTLNSRSLDWGKDHNVVTDATYGFISGLYYNWYICIVISYQLDIRKQEQLCCCFVDYQNSGWFCK
jgi:hypothetical protein